MVELKHIKVGEDKFKISDDEVARRELKITKIDEDVIQVQEEVHGIIAAIGGVSSVNIKKEELKEIIKIAKEEFGWTDLC
ncbi:hypothetical protein PAP_10135 [Palaeococcus pacificus DY20341]|uniref:Uncharacterized protein n=1 Tax=Palaeococcus pacificus DY20341 TaxID=1343739 RepID=A0A075LVN1_9EURY|nr:hypothetical protein [Palaeococcus pacificus]AIF70399.1 hypothetical protein PAP_10135 [Palaeococcus pacificus DY20341]